MLYLDNTYIFELNVNKSKFIAVLTSAINVDEVNATLLDIKNKYNGANHFCYAYIIDNIVRSSDDAEPHGSAGAPILNVMTKNNLNHVLCVVIRYFGGVKLGVGGLVKSYTSSVVGALKKASFVTFEDALYVEVLASYDNIKKVERLLIKADIVLKSFDSLIKLGFNINNNIYNSINYELALLSEVVLIKNIKMKKSV